MRLSSFLRSASGAAVIAALNACAASQPPPSRFDTLQK